MAKAPGGQNSVAKLYQTVIDDVINNIREAFLDDGVDEHVLQELKQTWEQKLAQSKAVESPTNELRHAQSVMPMYVYANAASNEQNQQQVMYHTMTAAGQQAAMSLPNSVIYQRQQLPNQQTQVYAPYQASSLQTTSQSKVIQSQTNPASSEDSGKQPGQHPSVIIQVDGAADKKKNKIQQVDGNVDSSSDDDDDDDDDEVEEEEQEVEAVDEEPLGSADDGSEDDPVELFDTDNVVVCQYDKIQRNKCRWKFNLKVGIMNLNGKDLVFQKATGDAEW